MLKSKYSGHSLSACQQSVQQIAGKDSQDAGLSLCGKPSFLVCRGRKSSGLTEVDSFTDLSQPQRLALQQTNLKIQGIIKLQQHIIELVDDVDKKIAGEKSSRKMDDSES
ncbi:uncharacterized protein LOC108116735 [Drosophila eugracilis]|uniref:uncharacterized protein LOC108116735 n=1 Tax=Drosophila eugracilis TaxID=29029 RepID=UPI0007E7B011|nr:uncharacterized protein LOC108116735 [Drosophila eugracilis]